MTGMLLTPPTAVGQGLVVDLSAGAAEYDAVDGELGTLNAILGVRRDGPLWVSLSGGVPLDSTAIPWLAGGAGTRWSRFAGQLELGLDAAALGFGYRISNLGVMGGGATLLGLPFAAYRFGPLRLEGQAGVLHHSELFDGEASSRTVHQSAIRARYTVRPSLALAAEGKVVGASEGAYPFAGASVEFTRGPLAAWLRGGRWMADRLEAGTWSLGGRMNVSRTLAVRASYEREADDPLYWNGSRSSWSIGVSHALGKPPVDGGRVAPPESFRTASGPVELRVDAEDTPGTPSIAGDFTEWSPVPMRFQDGTWVASFVLPAGVYHYSFQHADGGWFLPDSVKNRVADGFGGVNGVLVVVGS